jgi:hypothetical protein
LDAEVASGVITADMSGPHEGWFRIQIGQLDQRIVLVSRPRHFGGRQWYFVCPYMNRRDGVVDAARGPFLCFAAALGAAGGLCFTIHVPR